MDIYSTYMKNEGTRWVWETTSDKGKVYKIYSTLKSQLLKILCISK